MKADEAIVEILEALPERKVEGKKRLQKLAHLTQLAGADIDARYYILHYGPFSKEIANAVSLLSLTGIVRESVLPLGVYGRLQSVFVLSDRAGSKKKLPPKFKKLVADLNRFSTIELEVASTIGYFEKEGDPTTSALQKTREMKPEKAKGPVLRNANRILGLVGQ